MRLTQRRLQKLSKLTPFERAVLLECSRISRGQTRTYSQIARAIGKPNAARAVGNALGKNPLAPSIPCHRVVCSNGKFGGYSAKGGVLRKEALLLKEKNRSAKRRTRTYV